MQRQAATYNATIVVQQDEEKSTLKIELCNKSPPTSRSPFPVAHFPWPASLIPVHAPSQSFPLLIFCAFLIAKYYATLCLSPAPETASSRELGKTNLIRRSTQMRIKLKSKDGGWLGNVTSSKPPFSFRA